MQQHPKEQIGSKGRVGNIQRANPSLVLYVVREVLVAATGAMRVERLTELGELMNLGENHADQADVALRQDHREMATRDLDQGGLDSEMLEAPGVVVDDFVEQFVDHGSE